jgi:hypothetical protein
MRVPETLKQRRNDMRQLFKRTITLGGATLHGVKLAESEFISKRYYLTTALAIYQVSDPDRAPFIITARNQLGWRQLYSSSTLEECVDWLKAQNWLPAEPVAKIVAALSEKPQAKRGRLSKPKVSYATRKRRDGSKVSVTVGVGDKD